MKKLFLSVMMLAAPVLSAAVPAVKALDPEVMRSIKTCVQECKQTFSQKTVLHIRATLGYAKLWMLYNFKLAKQGATIEQVQSDAKWQGLFVTYLNSSNELMQTICEELGIENPEEELLSDARFNRIAQSLAAIQEKMATKSASGLEPIQVIAAIDCALEQLNG